MQGSLLALLGANPRQALHLVMSQPILFTTFAAIRPLRPQLVLPLDLTQGKHVLEDRRRLFTLVGKELGFTIDLQYQP